MNRWDGDTEPSLRRLRSLFVTVLFAIVISACSKSSSVADLQPDVDWNAIAGAAEAQISWREDVQPVLEKRCVVCHGCYDAPCQLKLTSYEGLMRGANPRKVYDGARIKAAQPTRLGIDATTTEEWRDRNFHPVIAESQVQDEREAADFMRRSVLYRLLRLKQLNPQPRTGLLPEAITLDLGRKQACTTEEKVARFERRNPLWGMPYGMPNLPDEEYRPLVQWLAQGARPPESLEESNAAADQIEKWELFLNGASNRDKLVSRYIYEHLFLAHIHFAGSPERDFYRLVRSYTPPGETVREVPTTRPFDDPGVDDFWYRLRRHERSIVDKSHILYEFSDAKLNRFKELFLSPRYVVEELPGYELPAASNPFITFAVIPSASRYRFLLDDARFFIQGFIKGPVCRGQVALNVIEDQFWVFFASPDTTENEITKEVLKASVDYLQMPSSTQTFRLRAAYTRYWDGQKAYLAAKSEAWADFWPTTQEGAINVIWDGDGYNKNAALTIFRNFDSAAVEYGLLGQFPETAWVINYSLFERIHYLLVAGFDVYGNVGHQLNTRLFMDFLRMEGEDNFLSFLPAESRQAIRASWYEGMRSKRSKYFQEPMHWLTHDSPIEFQTADPQAELYQLLINHLGPVGGPPDLLNRCVGEVCSATDQNAVVAEVDGGLRGLALIRGEQLSEFPELAYVRVVLDGEEDLNYSLIHNRQWKNVTSFLEDASNANRDPSADTLTVLRGLSGSYPNFFFSVQRDEVEQFVSQATSVKTVDDYQLFVARFGLRRTATDFWEQADWFQSRHLAEQPLEAGIFDLNRYENR